MRFRDRLIGGYTPLRRAYRFARPAWMAPLTEAGREIDCFVNRYGMRVRHGPFAGLRYPARARGHVNFLAAKILGAYESELHMPIEQVIAAAPNQIVNVGSGEGYYAVGLAMRTPQTTNVYAFELDAGERRVSAESARLNGVESRIKLGGYCDPAGLAETLLPNACLICDCEGYEVELLRPDLVPQLGQVTILAELHPTIRPGVEQLMRDRFRDTHLIDIIKMASRDPAAFKELEDVAERASYLLLSEGWRSEAERPSFERCWAFMSPR